MNLFWRAMELIVYVSYQKRKYLFKILKYLFIINTLKYFIWVFYLLLCSNTSIQTWIQHFTSSILHFTTYLLSLINLNQLCSQSHLTLLSLHPTPNFTAKRTECLTLVCGRTATCGIVGNEEACFCKNGFQLIDMKQCQGMLNFYCRRIQFLYLFTML